MVKLKGGLGTGTLWVIALMIILVVIGAQLTNGLVPTRLPKNTGTIVTPKYEPPEPGKEKLQLYTFGFTTPAPTVAPQPTRPPTSSCPWNSIKPAGCGQCDHGESVVCAENPCNRPGFNVGSILDGTHNCAYIKIFNEAAYNQKLGKPNCVEACIAKPVIYLYPTVATLVDVLVKVPGKIFISDPLYPEGGWKNVLAYPDGSLLYKNQKYSELFFESDVDKVNAPQSGIVIAKKDLTKTLTEAITKLGLIGAEKKEFLDFWIPVLNELDSPYILFSVLDNAEKERVDHVEISPKPDTFIAFIAYFKPLAAPPVNLKVLSLPENPPERIGFTAVEWGGTIDY